MKQDNFHLGQLVGELVGEVKGIRNDIVEIKKFIKEYDQRIGELENWRAQVAGVILGVSTVVSTLITIIGLFVQKIIVKNFN